MTEHICELSPNIAFTFLIVSRENTLDVLFYLTRGYSAILAGGNCKSEEILPVSPRFYNYLSFIKTRVPFLFAPPLRPRRPPTNGLLAAFSPSRV